MLMNICSVCNQETISEPYDKSKPVVCEDCKFKCKDCGERVYGGGHVEFCNSCISKRRVKKQENSRITIIDNTKYRGTTMNESHYKHLNTRVLNDQGEALSGSAGLDYMKSKGDAYSSRLKEYYK